MSRPTAACTTSGWPATRYTWATTRAARGALLDQLRSLIGDQGATIVQTLLASTHSRGSGLLASVVGVVTLLLGATSVFGELQSSLDRIWHAPAVSHQGFWLLLRSRVLSFGLILALGFLLLVSLAIGAALTAVGKWWGTYFSGWALVLQVVNQIISFGIVTVLFALIYRFLPRARVAWRDVWVGALVTAVLFSIGKYSDWRLSRYERHRVRLRRRRIARRDSRVGLLLGAGVPARRGVHVRLRPRARVTRRRASCPAHRGRSAGMTRAGLQTSNFKLRTSNFKLQTS